VATNEYFEEHSWMEKMFQRNGGIRYQQCRTFAVCYGAVSYRVSNVVRAAMAARRSHIPLFIIYSLNVRVFFDFFDEHLKSEVGMSLINHAALSPICLTVNSQPRSM
jgi:hypothetical protein